mgnify:CR=1 FL=1
MIRSLASRGLPGVLVVSVLALAASSAWAVPVRGSSQGLEVSLTTDPPVIALGKARIRLDIRDSGKPLNEARVRVLVRMPNMDMGEREETARPVPDAPGAYTAPAVFSMAGVYVADITVISGGAERKLQLNLAVGMDTGPERSGGGLLTKAGAAAALVFMLFTVYRMRKTGQKVRLNAVASPRTLMNLILLGVALAVSIYAVRNWRRPGAMTPIEAQAMEMATPPPPGVAPVTVARVDRGTVEQTVTYVGQVAGWVEQDIYARVSGWIVDMPVYVGTRVRKGDLLARLDTSELRPMVLERSAGVRAAREAEDVARAEETQARSALNRALSLAEAVRVSVRTAEAEARAANAGLAEARENLAAAWLLLDEARANVDAAQAEHSYAAAELRRMQSLRDRGAVSEQELQRTRADAASARSAIAQAASRVSQAEAAIRGHKARVRAAVAAQDVANRRVDEARERLKAMQAEADAAGAAAAAAAGKRRMARSGVKQADAMLLASRTSERYAEIRASADGIVTRRILAPGVLASPGQAILQVAQTSPVRLQANVSEADLHRIRVGAGVEAWRLDDPTRRAKAVVTSVSPQVDPSTKTATVEAVWANAAPSFAVGEAITMRISVGSAHHALRVPIRAVEERVGGGSAIEGRQAGSYVWLARSDGPRSVARRVTFEVGIRGDTHVAVQSGLEEGDLVIVEGAANLRDGDEIVHSGPPASSGGTRVEQAAYVCPMHPDVRQDKPGRCPRCGMALVPEGSRQ